MLSDFERIRERKSYAKPFPGELEAEYRRWQRKRYRDARVALFLIAAIAFGLSPLYDFSVVQPTPEFLPLLRRIQWFMATPLALLGALVTAFDRRLPLSLTRGIQLAAIAGFWATVLAMRWFALHGQLHYPPDMIGVVILAVAIFGGFAPRRVFLGATLYFALAIAIEARFDEDMSIALRCFSLIYLYLIAVTSSFLHELLSRVAWVNRRLSEMLARTDPLSGLANRAEFNRGYLRLLAMARRERCALGIAFVDIDHFKKVNDRHGHLFGDEVIREVGQVIAAHHARRPFDLKARFGGEEFVLIWYQVPESEFGLQLERLLQDIRDIELPADVSGTPTRITASAGGVWVIPDSTMPAEALLDAADQMLYIAKSMGRNRAEMRNYQASQTAKGMINT